MVPTDSPKPDRPAAESTGEPEFDYPVTFRINRIAYFTVPAVALLAVLMIGASPWFAPTLIIPVILAYWIHRLRTVVTEDGLRAVGTFGTTDLRWSDIDGLQFPKWSSVRAVRPDGVRVRLPAIGFRDLPALSVVSGGRIPDPFEAAAKAGR